MNTHYRLAVVARVAVIAGCMGMSSTLSARTDPQNVQTGADGARADHDEQAQSQGQMIRSAAQAPPVETRERVTAPVDRRRP